MRYARTLLVAAAIAVPAVATAPGASACAGQRCIERCVFGIVDQVLEGDLFITCEL